MQTKMLPQPDIATGMFLTYLSVLRETNGPKFCRKRLVGPLRARFDGLAVGMGRVDVLAKSSTPGDFARVIAESQSVLAFHCSMCSHAECKLKNCA